jgi:branched-chain amino acid transport system ATP-binding protein
MIKKMIGHIQDLNRGGQTFFIVEHNMDVIMELCHRVIVLNYGEKIAEGPPEAIRKNEQVIEAYFGS